MKLLILLVLALILLLDAQNNVQVTMNGDIGKGIPENVTMSEEEFEKEFETLVKEEESQNKVKLHEDKRNVNKPKPAKPVKPNKPKKQVKVVNNRVNKPKKQVEKQVEAKSTKSKTKPKSIKSKVVNSKVINKVPSKPVKPNKPKVINEVKKQVSQMSSSIELDILHENLDKLSKEEIITKYNELKKNNIMLTAKINVQQEMLNSQSGSNMGFTGSISGPDHMPSLYEDGMYDGVSDEDTEANEA